MQHILYTFVSFCWYLTDKGYACKHLFSRIDNSYRLNGAECSSNSNTCENEGKKDHQYIMRVCVCVQVNAFAIEHMHTYIPPTNLPTVNTHMALTHMYVPESSKR